MLIAVVALAGGAASLAGAAQLPSFRPVSLGDLVKSVGENRDGLEEEVDLSPFVADHATFAGDAVGFAARVRDDPKGPIFVAWRRPGELWIYNVLDDLGLASVRAVDEDDVRPGRVEGLRPFGPHLVIETRDPVTSVVLDADLTPLVHARGSARAALATGGIVLLRQRDEGAGRSATLALLDPGMRRAETFYTARGASLSSIELDAGADALTFSVAAGDRTTRVTCAPMSRPSRACSS